MGVTKNMAALHCWVLRYDSLEGLTKKERSEEMVDGKALITVESTQDIATATAVVDMVHQLDLIGMRKKDQPTE